MSVTNHIYCILHGYGVASSGDYPYIAIDLDITFTKSGNNVSWYVSNNDWTGTDSGTGTYGYPFAAYISINKPNPTWDDLYYVVDKPVTTGSYWWNSVTNDEPSGSFTTTSNTGTLYVWVQGGPDSCMSNGHFCYTGTNTYYLIDTFPVTFETAVSYTVTYRTQDGASGRSGTPIPAPQTTDSVGLMLDRTVPTLPLYIGYHFDTTQTVTVNKVFNNWKCDYDSQIYAPGSIYRGRTTTNMRAQWGDATFTPMAIPNKYYTLTYNANGGYVSPLSNQLTRSTNGYATSAGSTTKVYTPGVAVTTAIDRDLYPIYQTATVVYNNLPIPTKGGYRFDGWYKDSALTQKIDADYAVSADTTIYAKWTPLAVNQFQPNNTWDSIGAKVWRFNGTNWEPIAHVMEFDNGQWKDLSQ